MTGVTSNIVIETLMFAFKMGMPKEIIDNMWAGMTMAYEKSTNKNN